jgi:hypothetical protein
MSKEEAMQRAIRLSTLLLFAIAPAATAQVGVAAHAGTMGLGADVAVSLTSRLGLRAGANIMPYTPKFTADDVDYEFNFPSPQFTAIADLFLVGGLRLSGGVRISTEDISLSGQLTSSVDIGNATYTPTEVGTLTGAVVTKEVAPYLGIGFGNVARSRIGFFADIGVALHGTPEVTLTASEGSLASDPTFQDDLAREAQSFQDDIDWFTFYPVLSLGISFGFGG